MADVPRLDKETLIAIAGLVRRRVDMQDRADLMAGKDGMARYGAKRALDQLAVDLRIMADHVDRGEDDEDEDTA